MSEDLTPCIETLEQRTARVLAAPDFFTKLLRHLTNGGSVIDYANAAKIRFDSLTNWVHEDERRNKQYIRALNDGNEWLKQRIIDEFKSLATTDITALYDADGALKPMEAWPEREKAAVLSVDTYEEFSGRGEDKQLIGYTKRIKLADKLRALELIAKTLAMFKDQEMGEGLEAIADAIREGQERANTTLSIVKQTDTK